MDVIFNRPGVVEAVLQSPPSLINSVSDGLGKYLPNTVNPKPEELTGFHPCSYKSQSLPAPDTHLTNSRTLCHTCMTRGVGRGGVGISCFSNIHLRFTRPSVYKKSKQFVFEKNMVMFTPNLDQFRGI